MHICDLSYLEDVSEASSVVGGASLKISINNGKTRIQSKGFKVVKKESKKNGVNSISITATSSNKGGSYSNVSVTSSTSIILSTSD